MVRRICRPEHLYGSKEYGSISYIHGDLEIKRKRNIGVTNTEWIEFWHPKFQILYGSIWPVYDGNTVDWCYQKDVIFEGNPDELIQLVTWLRLTSEA